MAQVSRWKLKSGVWERVFDLFLETIVGIRDKRRLERFLDCFFSPTEKIMFAKRLACMVLLAKEHDYESIKGILHMSQGTISKMSVQLKYEGEGLKPVVDDILNRQAGKIFWEEIKGLFDFPSKGSLKSPERYKRINVKEKKIRQVSREF